MNILLTAATHIEIEPLLEALENGSINSDGFEKYNFDTLITGVGMVATAFSLGKQFAKIRYDLAINVGIAGAFDRTINIGDVVEVHEDIFAELGAEDGDEFLPITQLGFGEQAFHSTYNPSLLPSSELQKVKSVTVNRVHGNELTIAKTLAKFHPQIESMEGAAFFYACKQENIPAMQVRAISNYVERRNREKWNVPMAIKSLNNYLVEFLSK